MSAPVLEEVAQRGREYLARTDDNKVWATEAEMRALLADPNSIQHTLNAPACGKCYVTEVFFLGMRFITSTKKPIDFGAVVA